ncbi:hypothetical protein LWI28_026471 [Acer negundo]|uniref:AT3G52170-like helix-turn-helix domain-containing protein n=1 Tax=Acer negundo TaxID=4023 RepID=A0AAD5NPA2_ACENE|nr:hypothetical protein LWI28_026471 [Acer negundo]
MLSFSRTAKYSAHRFLPFRNKSVVGELNNVACGSNIRWRGRSYAASVVPSDSLEPQRVRKRVSKEERRALVESYVNKYRAEHNGKFPSASDAIKNVGGCFYVNRMIIKELEYKSKISSSNRGTENLSVGPTKKNKVTVDVGTQNELHILAADDVEINDASEKHLGDEGAIASSVAANTLSEDIEKLTAPSGQSDIFATQSELLTDDKKVEAAQGRHIDFATESRAFKEEIDENFHKDHENADDKKEKAEDLPSKFVETESHIRKGETDKVSLPSFGNGGISEASLNSGGPKQEVEQHKLSPELEKKAKNISSKQTDDAELAKKSTLWENLKSFADGFIKMDKNMKVTVAFNHFGPNCSQGSDMDLHSWKFYSVGDVFENGACFRETGSGGAKLPYTNEQRFQVADEPGYLDAE